MLFVVGSSSDAPELNINSKHGDTTVQFTSAIVDHQLTQRLGDLPTADENAFVEAQLGQLQNAVHSTASGVLDRLRREHQDWFDDNGAVNNNLFTENGLRRTSLDRQTDANQLAFHRRRRLAQQ
ncbi:hypothetical protein SprV_0100384900 [Sparganum proliferum]